MSLLPRVVVTELYLGGWTDISGDVLVRDAITITRGRKAESGSPDPSSATLTLRNRSGAYSPRNPLGEHFGRLGRNTPIRLGIRAVRDTFSRTVSSGWGTTDTGQVWSTGGAGGTVSGPDWAVGSGAGTMAVPAANAYRYAYLAGSSWRDVDVAVTLTLAVTDVTGGQVEPANLMLRGQSGSDYYLVRLAISTTEAISLSLLHADGTVIASAVTVPGLTHSATQTLRIRAQAEGHTLRARVWPATDPEPFDWQVSAHTELITDPGWIGIRSGVAAGNTNTKPVVVGYDELTVVLPRFAGEIAAWPPRWDRSGNDVSAPIEAAGVGRRLGQGQPPIGSSMRRGLTRTDTDDVVAYWPCEQGKASTVVSSGLSGGAPMYINGAGSPDWEANTDFAASDPLPTPKTTYWIGQVPLHTVSGRQQIRWLMSVPAGGIAQQSLLAVRTSGSVATWLVQIDTSGGLRILAYDRSGTNLLTTVFVAFAVNGSPRWFSLEYEQVGSDVIVNLVTLQPGAPTGLQMPLGGATISGQTLGITREVQMGSIGDVGVGHISVHRTWSSLFLLGNELAAYVGETAGARLARLAAEESAPFTWIGDLTSTVPMGPQRSDTLLNLLTECAAADMGTLYETRADPGLCYRTRTSLYNQAPTVNLDYGAGQLASPFEPVDDDRLIRNDITVKRPDGGEARQVLATGPLSVLPPQLGGVGRYTESVTLNVADDTQLGDLAAWRLHLGTVDEARYPTVRVNLASPRVAALEPRLLALDVDDRITISNPKPVHTPDQITQLARGYAETLNVDEHTLSLICAPESPYHVIELDGPYRLDSDASALAVPVTSSATSLTVAALDCLWTTTPGEWPIDIVVGGERMTVTAVTGSSSPQAFTVTRSINGVVKAHAAGTTVHVADPGYLPL